MSGSQHADFLRGWMFERRIVTVTGILDSTRAGDAAAALMTLDALGDEHIDLRVDCAEGSLEGAFTLMDTIDLLGVPVHVTCTGQVGGAAVGVLAVGARRLVTPHARVLLREPRIEVRGTATDIAQQAADQQSRLEHLQTRLAEATGHPFEHIEAEMQRGCYLSAEEAVAYGLADAVAAPRMG